MEKIECVGHVQKRTGLRIRNLRAQCGKGQLADGKIISGRGRLTEDQVKSMQQYHGNAVRDNKGDLKAMRQVIWATFFHKGSTDEQSSHNFCLDFWCPYTKAEKGGTSDTYKHTISLLPSLMTSNPF